MEVLLTARTLNASTPRASPATTRRNYSSGSLVFGVGAGFPMPGAGNMRWREAAAQTCRYALSNVLFRRVAQSWSENWFTFLPIASVAKRGGAGALAGRPN